MTTRLFFRWLGWTLLYALTLWSLWADAALLAPHARDPTPILWVWITAVLAPFALAMLGALAVEASWWTAIPPLVIGMSLLALTAFTWRDPSFAHEVGAASVLTLLLGPGAERSAGLLGLAVLTPPLAYGLARVGLGMSQSTEEPRRSALRGFARWLLVGVPLVAFGIATGDGMAAFLGAIALYVAGRHIGLNLVLWRYVR